jgi:PAS domain-containing protein
MERKRRGTERAVIPGRTAMATDRADPGGSSLSAEFLRDSNAILRVAMESLFERLNSICEGAIAVDRQARVVWIADKYVSLLGLSSADEALERFRDLPELAA